MPKLAEHDIYSVTRIRLSSAEAKEKAPPSSNPKETTSVLILHKETSMLSILYRSGAVLIL